MMKQGKDVNKEPSELILKIGEEIGVNEFGRTVIRTQWVKADKDINLGSMKKPLGKVIEFKYRQKQTSDVFRGFGFFGGE